MRQFRVLTTTMGRTGILVRWLWSHFWWTQTAESSSVENSDLQQVLRGNKQGSRAFKLHYVPIVWIS